MSASTTADTHSEQIVLPSQEVLIAAFQRVLEEALFSNRLMVAPRRIRDSAQDEARFALEALHGGTDAQIRERGQRLAEQGLGLTSILNLCTALRCAVLGEPNRKGTFDAALAAVDHFSGALLEGYVATCQEELRREQQRTLAAYQRSLD